MFLFVPCPSPGDLLAHGCVGIICQMQKYFPAAICVELTDVSQCRSCRSPFFCRFGLCGGDNPVIYIHAERKLQHGRSVRVE
jgi:hypothetical protein